MKSEIENLAYEFARYWHDGQFRNDNITPYIVHPISVVGLLKSWGVGDSETIAAAYLHDLLEDTEVNEEQIRKVFGLNILNKVKKLTHSKDVSKNQYMENIAKDADLYVSLIKYADRLCNVVDFLVDGNKKYAFIYFHKADIIFNRLSSERNKLGKIFDNLLKDKKSLENIFKYIQKDEKNEKRN